MASGIIHEIDAYDRLRDDVFPNERAFAWHEKSFTTSFEFSTSMNSYFACRIDRGQTQDQRLGEVVKYEKVELTALQMAQADTGIAWYAWALVYDTAPVTTGTPATPLWDEVFGSNNYTANWHGSSDGKGRFIVVHHEINFVTGKAIVIPGRVKKYTIDISKFHTRWKTSATTGAPGTIIEGAWYIVSSGSEATGSMLAVDARFNLRWTWVPATIPRKTYF